jgi:hypothetical protein
MPGSAPAPTASAPQPPVSQASAPLTPADPGHPDNALYQSVKQQLVALDASEGIRRTPQQLKNGVAGIMADARVDRLRRVIAMEYGETDGRTDTRYVSIFDGEPDDVKTRFSSTDMQQATATPAAQSYQNFELTTQQQLTRDQDFAQRQELDRQQSQSMGHSLA